VVIHVPAAGNHDAILRNIVNLRAAVVGDVRVEVVVHGAGIDLALAQGPAAAAVTEMIASGVVLSVCRNTMTSKNLDAADVVYGADTVASGVATVAQRQWEGCAYVRL
jgi:intracellular sulfur oxidation DsrE/DsrF family protein